MTDSIIDVNQARIAVLTELTARQHGDNGYCNGTSPIVVSIGNVSDRQVRHDTLLIKEAPPIVFTKVADLVARYRGITATITPEGLLLSFHVA